ncbi:aryl hydrocarbon receptor 2 isoform X2 [Girardinichthys multiradiatus]|uniref:aryl hydrocarbon receptor 2 isoform X2 n=1 Tax=Girardinichthys multiradiatus TaxID=208333 RepID=UPI001FADB3ED|nr:aryl hydrocarbon receptor 2 isoform X2 [Girardinichthys multiradiatus]
MLQSTPQYAMKKRKKPVQKAPKPPPPDGTKSNPSKRHRDRLNGELDKLTNLLPFPEEVRARLDKLSVLRLSVGYLKVKSFFNVMKAGPNGSSWTSERDMFGGNVQRAQTSSLLSSFSTVSTSIDGVRFSEGELLLQALNGFVLVVTAEGYVFYTSPTIQDFLGFHQSDVVHQSVFELIHTDDRALFRRQLHFSLNPNADGSENPSEQNSSEIRSNVVAYDLHAIPPENSSFLERNFCCRFRCLLDNSSGFLALNFSGRLKFLNGQHRVSENGALVPPHLALFAIATPLQQPSILEIRTKTLIFQTKHKLDFTPIGIDARAKIVLGYNEVEISMKGSGYSFIHAADMMYCADKHVRMIRTGETGFTFFRLLTKDRCWVWVQSNCRLVYKDGRPEFIVARQRALTNEEGEEQLRLRQLQLPFNFATGEAQLYDLPLSFDVPDSCSAPKNRKPDGESCNSNSLLGCLLSQDRSVYCKHEDPNNISSLSDLAFQDTHAALSIPREPTPKPTVSSSLLKMDPTIQDMVETLEKIFGDTDLIEGVDVGPEELQSWETSLMNFNAGNEEVSREDLSDILSGDILTYVAEQLQQEGGLMFPDQLDKLSSGISPVNLQNQNPDLARPQNFSWPLLSQNQLTPNGGQMVVGQPPPLSGTLKLSHLDCRQMSSGLNGLQTQMPCPSSPQLGSFTNMMFNPSCRQTQGQLFKASPTNVTSQLNANQTDPTTQRLPQIGGPVLDQNTGVFIFTGNERNDSNSAQNFVDPYAPNISNIPSLPADSFSNCYTLQMQNSQQQMSVNQISGFHTNLTIQDTFSSPEIVLFPDQLDCMYRNSAAAQPSNGVHDSQARTNPDSFQNTSCYYQALPGGETVAALPTPKEAPLSYQMAAALKSNGLTMQQHFPYFSTNTQMDNHLIVRKGGFPLTTLPNGNTCLTENK